MLTITVDAADAQRICATAERQVRYAASRAINKVANEVRDQVRTELAFRFVVRRKAFMRQQVQVHRYSDKRDPEIWAEVGTGTKGGVVRDVDILGKFEAGGVKTARSPDEPVAIPSENIRKSPLANVPLALYPKNLRLVPRKGVVGIMPALKHVTKRGVVQLKGLRRTFVLDPNTMFGVKTWGVYQRTSKRKVRLLWTYKRRIPIPRLLGFRETAERVVTTKWGETFARFLKEAMATAR